MISVLLVDGHTLVRKGMARMLEEVQDIEVVGQVGSGEEALPLVRNAKPDLVILEVHLPGIGGLETTRKLTKTHPEIGVIVVSSHSGEPYPSRLLKAGARGYLTKSCQFEELLEAVRAVYHKERYLGSDIARQVALSMLPGGDRSPLESLSPRELQIMMMVTQGQGIQEISGKLHLSPKTVATYRYRLYEKLGVGNDVQLAHLAIRHGLIDLGPRE
jgi:two-component system invasion response regulator UvrY